MTKAKSVARAFSEKGGRRLSGPRARPSGGRRVPRDVRGGFVNRIASRPLRRHHDGEDHDGARSDGSSEGAERAVFAAPMRRRALVASPTALADCAGPRGDRNSYGMADRRRRRNSQCVREGHEQQARQNDRGQDARYGVFSCHAGRHLRTIGRNRVSGTVLNAGRPDKFSIRNRSATSHRSSGCVAISPSDAKQGMNNHRAGPWRWRPAADRESFSADSRTMLHRAPLKQA